MFQFNHNETQIIKVKKGIKNDTRARATYRKTIERVER